MNSRRSAAFLNDKEDYLEEPLNTDYIYNGECGLGYINCQRCNCRLENYNEDTLGSLIVICSTLVHRETVLAAPFILDMIIAVAR